MKKIVFISCIALAIMTFTLWSCNDHDHYYYGSNSAAVYIVNTSPNSPGLTFYADQNRVNSTSLTYTNVKGYYFFYTGKRNIRIENASTGNTLTSSEVTMSSNTYYGLYAIDTLENMDILAIEEDFRRPASGKSHIRFIHLSPDAKTAHAAVGNNDTIRNVEFKEHSDYLSINNGVYDITIIDSSSNTALTQLQGQTFNNQRIYTIYLRGYDTPPSGNTNALGIEVIKH